MKDSPDRERRNHELTQLKSRASGKKGCSTSSGIRGWKKQAEARLSRTKKEKTAPFLAGAAEKKRKKKTIESERERRRKRLLKKKERGVKAD